jgi:hypothetical protein
MNLSLTESEKLYPDPTERMARVNLRGPLVYFLGSGPNTIAVKVGWTDRHLLERMEELQTGNPAVLHLLAAIRGGRDIETALHRSMAPYRLRGEWFYAPHALAVVASFRKVARDLLVYDAGVR